MVLSFWITCQKFGESCHDGIRPMNSETSKYMYFRSKYVSQGIEKFLTHYLVTKDHPPLNPVNSIHKVLARQRSAVHEIPNSLNLDRPLFAFLIQMTVYFETWVISHGHPHANTSDYSAFPIMHFWLNSGWLFWYSPSNDLKLGNFWAELNFKLNLNLQNKIQLLSASCLKLSHLIKWKNRKF